MFGRYWLFGMEKGNRIGGMQNILATSNKPELLQNYATQNTYLEKWHIIDSSNGNVIKNYSKPYTDYAQLDISNTPFLED